MGGGVHELVVLLDEVEVVLVAVDLLAHPPLELADHDNFIIFINYTHRTSCITSRTSSTTIFAIT
jgi:hypothetical protein